MNFKYIDHDLSNHVGFDRRFKYYQPVKPTWNIWTYVKYIRNELNPPLLDGYGQTRYGLPLNRILPYKPGGFRPR